MLRALRPIFLSDSTLAIIFKQTGLPGTQYQFLTVSVQEFAHL
jgi:hypothetical protein